MTFPLFLNLHYLAYQACIAAGNAIGSASQSQTNAASKEINSFNAEKLGFSAIGRKAFGIRIMQALISRGLNPYIGSNVGAGVSKTPASGGGSALASMAQARASMMNAYRNIGIGQSGYWNASTGGRSALLDLQELRNMEFGRLKRHRFCDKIAFETADSLV